MNGAIRLGRFADADVVADISALLLALFFGGAVFVHLRRSIVDVSNESAAVLAVLAGVSVVGCVFVHEAGHVVVARRRGLSVRSIRLFMFGGYSVIDGAAAPRTEFLIAAAGPAASLVLGVLLLSGTYLLGTDSLIGSALWAVGLASLAIGIFNLLPGFPLDGGRVVRSVLVLGGRDRVQATRIVTTVGRGLGVVSMVLGSFLLVTFNPTGLFWLVGGWLLMSSAVYGRKTGGTERCIHRHHCWGCHGSRGVCRRWGCHDLELPGPASQRLSRSICSCTDVGPCRWRHWIGGDRFDCSEPLAIDAGPFPHDQDRSSRRDRSRLTTRGSLPASRRSQPPSSGGQSRNSGRDHR